MKKIYVKSNDKLLKNILKKIFAKFDIKIIDNDLDVDFIIEDFETYFLLNNEKKFQKPLDVFSLIDTMDIIYVKNFNNVRLFGDKKKLVSGDNEVFLTDIEFKILDVLFDVGKDGIYVDELVCSVFCKNTESNLKTLSTHIYNLKKKLLNIFENKKIIILENTRYKLDL